MGMKEAPARKGNAASKGQQPATDQTDKKVGKWMGGALGGDAGHSDVRKGAAGAKGATRKIDSKDKQEGSRFAGKSDPI